MDVCLETDRLRLRRFTERDADLLYDLDNDPEVMRFLNGGLATPRQVIVREILPRFLAASTGADGFGYWAAIERASGRFVGWFSFRPSAGDDQHEVELGYRLRPAAWGKGYATEGAGALIRKGFLEHGVRRVIATTYEENVASRRVMEKVGMTLMRTFRPTLSELMVGGSYHVETPVVFDGLDVEYALSKEDWERHQKDEQRRRSQFRAKQRA